MGSEMQYIAAKGSRLNDDQAQLFGERIEVLQEEFNGEVTPDVVLGDAQHEDSPLNSFFEWDDTQAAIQYRRTQARYLLRSIHVVVKVNDQETTTRAFHRVTIHDTEPADNGHEVDEPEPRQVYVSVQQVFTDAELRRQAIAEALRQLTSWRERYQQYQELAHVFKFIDTIQDTLDLAPEVEAVAE